MCIDIHLGSADELAVLEPVWRVLRRRRADVRIVVALPGSSTTAPTADTFEGLCGLLVARGLPWISRPRVDADAVVAVGSSAPLSSWHGIKIKLQHGCPVVGPPIRLSELTGFDAVLVHGELSRQHVARHWTQGEVLIGGYPKLVPLVDQSIDRGHWSREFGLHPRRRTVVYLATAGDGCSLDRFGQAVEQLGRKYNVLFKPHPTTLRQEPGRYELLRRSSHVLADCHERNVAPFLAVADLILADLTSGCLSEAMLADRPVVALAGDGVSPDNRLDLAAAVATDPTQLSALVARELTEDRYKVGRRRLQRRVFADLKGRDAEVASDAIVQLARQHRGLLLLSGQP